MSRLWLLAILQVGAFALLIVLCIRIALAQPFAVRRKRVLQLALYLVVAHLAVGVTVKDAWPITDYALMHGIAGLAGELSVFTFYGVDAEGREWRIDPYAWKSISEWHLHFWFWIYYARQLHPDQQHEALGWLYRLAEEQRARLARGDTAISVLGPASAPQWFMFQRQLHVPAEPYRGIRVYLETFTIGGAIAEAEQPLRVTRGHLDRKLMGEWKAP